MEGTLHEYLPKIKQEINVEPHPTLGDIKK
jgi:hypothetical protein